MRFNAVGVNVPHPGEPDHPLDNLSPGCHIGLMIGETFEPFTVGLAGGQTVSARHYPAGNPSAPALLLGHGAGAPQTNAFMVKIAEGLSARGPHVFTFNFAYMEMGRKIPDSNDRLESCFLTVVEAVRPRLAGGDDHAIFVGGKSMGGRIATQLVAKHERAAEFFKGVVVLGYPLHPPGRPIVLRTAHLPQIQVPMLVVQGSRDLFGTPAELRQAFAAVPAPWKLFVVPDGDHSFKLPARAKVSQEEILGQVMTEIAVWMGV